MQTEMQSVIKKVAEVTTLLSSLSVKNPLSLPRLVVVGQQSSGKSSVLQGLIGLDIFPRASGICTRVPLVLTILSDNSLTNNLYGEFSHLSRSENSRFQSADREVNADCIREEIVSRTNALAGTSEVKNAPINLCVRAPGLPNLTVVDLPGLTRIATAGQNVGISEAINSMVVDYVAQESTIVLAVSPANADLANSESLACAQKHDPSGDRTIGIITKLDLMDRGTNCARTLSNKEFYLKLGYIGVVNRGQSELNIKTRNFDRNKEEKFFDEHDEYEGVRAHCGYSFLSSKLSEVFEEHLGSKMASLKNEVAQLYSQKLGELKQHEAKYGVGNSEEKILKCLNSFKDEFNACFRGENLVDQSKYKPESLEQSSGREEGKDKGKGKGKGKVKGIFSALFSKTKALIAGHKHMEMGVGMQINKMVDGDFKEKLDGIKALSSYSKQELEDLTIKTMGLSSSLLFSENVFKNLAFSEIYRLLEPTKTVNAMASYKILEVLEKILSQSDLANFPMLREWVSDGVKKFVNGCKSKIDERIDFKVSIETNYINVEHPEFFELPMKTFKEAIEKIDKSEPLHSRNIKIQRIVTMKLVTAYLDIIKMSLHDFFVRVYQKELLSKITDSMHNNILIDAINDPHKEQLVRNSKKVEELGKALNGEVVSLRKANEILSSIA